MHKLSPQYGTGYLVHFDMQRYQYRPVQIWLDTGHSHHEPI